MEGEREGEWEGGREGGREGGCVSDKDVATAKHKPEKISAKSPHQNGFQATFDVIIKNAVWRGCRSRTQLSKA